MDKAYLVQCMYIAKLINNYMTFRSLWTVKTLCSILQSLVYFLIVNMIVIFFVSQ